MILVTGAHGFLGQNLVPLLTEPHYSSKGRDLTDRGVVFDLFRTCKPTHVYHLAAKVGGLGFNMKDQHTSFLENTKINMNVIEACCQFGVTKIVAMGTGTVYPPGKEREEEIWTGEPHGSEIGYAHAKRHMLAQLELCKYQYGLDFAYVCSANIYGPHDKFDPENGHVIASLIYKSVMDKEITAWGTGIAKRDFIYSADAARALIMIMDNYSGIINLGSGEVKPISYVVETLKKLANKTVKYDSSMPDGQWYRAYNLDKLNNLGFKPSVTLEEGLKLTYEHFKKVSSNAA